MTKRTLWGIILIVAGLLKLADMWDILHWEWLWSQPWTEYIAPALLIYLGGDVIINGFRHSHDQWLDRPVPVGEDGKRICCNTKYGGDQYIYHGETFHGAKLDATFGGIKLDLREAVITEDEEIDIHTFFGGVEIYVPTNVDVVVQSRSFIGGVGDETNKGIKNDAKTLHIVASNFFGGVHILN